MTSVHRFSFPTSIHFGPGARHGLADLLRSRSLLRPLVVTDSGVARQAFLAEILGGLEVTGLHPALYSEVWGNPDLPQVTSGIQAYRAHHADSIVGIGGGAALDVAKAIALMIHHPGDLFDYEDGRSRSIDREIPTWIAMPTTSGTGSEVGRSSVISDPRSHQKRIIFSPRLMAREVLADPELTLKLPAPITAATGMDALTHCVEAYLARGYQPICDGIALEGARIAARSLARCVREPGDLDARSSMMMASMMGAIAFQKGLGVTHSCAHALGTVKDMHHGLANGIMIDHALRYNLSAAPERFRALAEAVGAPDRSPRGFLKWLSQLKSEIGIPSGLREAGVAPDELDRLVRIAWNDACHPCNPRELTEKAFREIFQEAA